ncbi:MAG: glucose-1-phosphate adenylyltransferase [Betaproteobacteria bacterium]|nr:glucose-1-phosphate adenylyltransferase [Betaproteobacteria bacterium]
MTRADLNDPLFPLEVLARRSPDPLSRSTMALILAGGRGSRLGELTDWRAKPSIPFGGMFRIIDFALSNCVNSGIRRIGICTQYKAQSLIRHVQRGWSFFDGRFAEFVELLPAQQRVEVSWYRGTADAVYQNLDILRLHAPDFVLVLAGDHVYKMDYGRMLEEHVACEAQLTIACIDVPLADARALGVVQIDDDGRIVRFDEKPSAPAPIPGNPGRALASMGIYVFDAGFLYAELLRDADDAASGHDFGRDLIPRLIAEGARVRAHDFARSCVNMYHDVPYWRDVGTVDAFYEANLALVKVEPELNLYDEAWPIWTHQEQLPPAKFVFDDDGRRGTALDSIVGSGCIVSGSTVRRSLLFSKVRVHSYCTIEDSVILPNVEIGRHVRLRRTIVDKHCRLPAGLVVGIDPAADRRRFHVTDGGVTLIIPEMLGQRIHHLR